MIIENIIDEWKSYMGLIGNYSKNTISSYINDVLLLQRFLQEFSDGSDTIINLSKQVLRAWILSRNNKKDDPKSIARGISAIKNFHRFLLSRDDIKQSEILRMKTPKSVKTLPRPLSISNLDKLINSVVDIKSTNWIVMRDKAILITIYSVGLRISEALSIKRQDIINSQGFIDIVGKGGKFRSVPLIESVSLLLLEYLEACPFSSEWLFVNRFGDKLNPTSVQKLVQKARRLLNLPENITPHSLRHTCATHIMENSGDIRGIQELLGHSSLNSTQIYADITRKYVIDIYDKCHPFSKNDEKGSNTEET